MLPTDRPPECLGKLFLEASNLMLNRTLTKTESQDVLEITFTKDGKKQTIIVAGAITIKEG